MPRYRNNTGSTIKVLGEPVAAGAIFKTPSHYLPLELYNGLTFLSHDLANDRVSRIPEVVVSESATFPTTAASLLPYTHMIVNNMGDVAVKLIFNTDTANPFYVPANTIIEIALRDEQNFPLFYSVVCDRSVGGSGLVHITGTVERSVD